jgi:non-lysosomal glucosylceramidase
VDANCWSDQANTCWSGVELAFSSFLVYEGFVREGLAVIRNVDDRYRKAGMYYDHQEFGGHYYRAMSAWAILNAFLGLSVKLDRYRFSPQTPGNRVKLFFASARGTAHYAHNRQAREVSLAVRTGELTCRELVFGGWPKAGGVAGLRLDGKTVGGNRFTVELKDDDVRLVFSSPLVLKAGQTLKVKMAKS